jgi:hypothetical protein
VYTLSTSVSVRLLIPENDSSRCPVQVGNDKSVGKSSWPDDGNTLSVLAWIAANIFMSRRRFNLRGFGNSMAAPRWERPARIEAIAKWPTPYFSVSRARFVSRSV